MKARTGRSASRQSATPTAAGARHKFLEIIPPGTRLDFIAMRGQMIAISCVLIAIGLVSLAIHGLNYGIDFAGGATVQVRFTKPTSPGDIRAALGRPELSGLVVQNFGHGKGEFLIRLGQHGKGISHLLDLVRDGLAKHFGKGAFEILRAESVGPQVSRELWRRAILAVLAATLAMGLYLWFRFDFRFGLGAAIALFHDVLIALGAISLGNIEFDLTIVAALLTVVGFSVNDTVVVSDRIRENMPKMRRQDLATIVNASINETLSRTVLTTGTALLVVLALFFLGGPVIHGFAFTLLVGFTVGTYSSMFIAAPIVVYFERPKQRR